MQDRFDTHSLQAAEVGQGAFVAGRNRQGLLEDEVRLLERPLRFNPVGPACLPEQQVAQVVVAVDLLWRDGDGPLKGILRLGQEGQGVFPGIPGVMRQLLQGKPYTVVQMRDVGVDGNTPGPA